MPQLEITLDYRLSLAKHIGDQHGIADQEYEELEPRLKEVQAHIQDQRGQSGYSFMDLPYDLDLLKQLKEYREQSDWVTDLVVFGIGGSSLGARALFQTFNTYSDQSDVHIHINDNLDPDELEHLFSNLDLKTALFCIISKSGRTLETAAKLPLIKQAYDGSGEEYKKHLVFVSTPTSGLLSPWARENDIPLFPHPEEVGGRYSVLSIVGMLPAVFMNINMEQLLAGAAAMDERCKSARIEDNPGLNYAAVQHLLATRKDKSQLVMMPYSERLGQWSYWFAQLWAESLGKRLDNAGNEVRTGQTPIKARGSVDQHSQTQLYNEGPLDKSLTFLAVDQYDSSIAIKDKIAGMPGIDYLHGHSIGDILNHELAGTRYSLYDNQCPTQTIHLPRINEHTIGQFIFMMEYATAALGELWNINAFNQPGVELGKNVAYALLRAEGYEETGEKVNKFNESLQSEEK